MLLRDLEKIIPKDWLPMDIYHEGYIAVKIQPFSADYYALKERIAGHYYSAITGMYKLQNPVVFAKYCLKGCEYERRGPFEIKSLYHDTALENVDSIASFNFDWRYGERYKFGPGVYFSVSPSLANKHSSRKNGLYRTMFIADVLVQKVQVVEGDIFLPDANYDTVLCHHGDTYVKYFDNEFYPRYFVNYLSIQ